MIKSAKAAGKTLGGSDFLNHKSSITEKFADYDPQHIAAMSVTAMVKVVAQMKNARRGHDAQGRVKKVNLDSSSEGYSNFMAPMRIERISCQTKMAKGDTHNIYNDDILRPATDTYLTAEWDEMVPFPNSTSSNSALPTVPESLLTSLFFPAWKIRFDGFGKSNYSKDGHPYGELHQPMIDSDSLAAPPFYQPQGASHVGGSFAEVVCICNTPGTVCHCKDPISAAVKAGKGEAATAATAPTPAELEPANSTGCGIGK